MKTLSSMLAKQELQAPESVLTLIREWGDAYAGRRSGLAPQELVDERWRKVVATLGVQAVGGGKQ